MAIIYSVMPQSFITVDIIRDLDGNINLPGGVQGIVATGCKLPNGMRKENDLLTVFLDPVTGEEIQNYVAGAIVATKILNSCNGSYVIVRQSISRLQYLITKDKSYHQGIRPTVLFDIGITDGIVSVDAGKSIVIGAATYNYNVHFRDSFGNPQIMLLSGITNSFALADLVAWNSNVFSVESVVTDSIGTGTASFDYIPTDSGGTFIGRLTTGCDPIMDSGDFNIDFSSDFLI